MKRMKRRKGGKKRRKRRRKKRKEEKGGREGGRRINTKMVTKKGRRRDEGRRRTWKEKEVGWKTENEEVRYGPLLWGPLENRKQCPRLPFEQIERVGTTS